MDLLVDIGNTRVRWCCAEHGQCSAAVVQAYDPEGVAGLLREPWASLPAPARVIAANVGGEAVAARIDVLTRELWGLRADYISAVHEGYGVTNGYVKAAQLGADRWAALVGAGRLDSGAKLIADCGTAMTMDVLTGDGRHLGGLILPGLTMMRRALLGGTSDLYISDEHDSTAAGTRLAHETSDAIKAGTLHMAAAALVGIAEDLEAELQCPLRRIITGGNASQLLPLINRSYTHEPDLILKGLLIIAGQTA